MPRGSLAETLFALIHGAEDSGWYWHLVEEELRKLGYDTVAPDLPIEDPGSRLADFAETVVEAIGDRDDVVVVAQSAGAFSAPLVAERVAARELILVAGMVPAPGETANEWFANTGWPGQIDDDPIVAFYHDVPRALAEAALQHGREEAGDADEPWPLVAWPDVPTRFVLCTQDRFFPPDFLRRVVAKRLGAIEIDEITASHAVALSRPAELAEILARNTPPHSK